MRRRREDAVMVAAGLASSSTSDPLPDPSLDGLILGSV